MKGYAINHRIEKLEKAVAEHSEKIDFFIRTSLPPVEGIFFDGQIFDAYVFVTNLIKSAKKSLILIDNYVDESVLLMLAKRSSGVPASIYTAKISSQLQLDLQRHNSQYPLIYIYTYKNAHDRFLIIDDQVYHIGASLKDLGKKLFAFSKLKIEGQRQVMNREVQHSLAEDFIGHTGHAVVTSSYKDIAMTYLENAGLLNICEYITSLESINFPKPNPEPYLFTMEKLQITNRDCIAVEDSPSGIRSARSAGLFTVAWVKDVNDTKYEDANIILSKLSSPQINSFFL